MDINLNSFKFIQGFNFAKNFLLQLKASKEEQILKNNKKIHTSNSLSFSPIMKKQSQISEHGTPDKQQEKKSFLQQSLIKKKQLQEQKHESIQSLKNKINIMASLLNQTHNEIVISESALEILSQHLRERRSEFKKIQHLKKQERQKTIKIQTLKNNIAKKRAQLEQKQKLKNAWKNIVANSVKQYLKQQQFNQSIQVIELFSPDYKEQRQRILQVQPEIQQNYPEKMNLKYKRIKKKEKKKQQKLTTSLLINNQNNEQKAGAIFVKQKKNKSFSKNPNLEAQILNNEIEKYYDDDIV